MNKRHTQFGRVAGLLLMALLCLAGDVSDALAQGAYGNVQATCQQIRQQVEASDIDKAYITEYLVLCTKTVVLDAFQQFVYQFYPHVHSIIMAAMTLAVTLFGVLLITGIIEKSSRDAFVGLFKLGCVLFFVRPDTASQVFQMGMDSMDALTDIVFQFGKGSGTSGKCIDNATVWDRMDCMLDVLIGTVKSGGGMGAGAAAAGQMEGISRGLMHMNMTNLASSGMGAMIGLMGVYVAYTTLMAAIKSIHTYLAAIIALAFILVFTPMFVPMVMFKATRTYFDKWHRIATSFVLQPVILFAFLSLMLIALEDMLAGSSNNGSYLKTMCGPQCTQYGQFPSKVLQDAGVFAPTGHTTGYDVEHTGRRTGKEYEGGAYGSKKYDVSSGSTGGPSGDKYLGGIRNPFTKIDYNKQGGLTGAGDETKQQEKMALASMALALTAFVFISMLNYIPNLATDLAGGIYEVPNLFKTMGEHLPVPEQLKGLGGKIGAGVSDRISRNFSGMTGQQR